jgi:hypothetical protein
MHAADDAMEKTGLSRQAYGQNSSQRRGLRSDGGELNAHRTLLP